jgi:hypothetical protein
MLECIVHSPRPPVLPPANQFLLHDILVGPALKTGFKVLNLAAFSKVTAAADIDKLTVVAKSVTFKSRPVLTIPPFMMGVLMHEESPDPLDLCMVVIRFCRDFNAQQNRDASDTLTIAAAAKPNDNASDDEEVDKEDADGDKKLAATVWAIGKKLISKDAEDKDWEMTKIDADGNVIEVSTTSPAQNVREAMALGKCHSTLGWHQYQHPPPLPC